MRTLFATLLLALAALPRPVDAARIKDLADVRGVRGNQLYGYGLVMGLDGTGDSDKTRFTIQSVVSMLSRMGIRVDPRGLKLKNVAAVIVTAELPPFARPGSTIDVTVSSIGDARSLTGGTLLVTPLRGHDGQIYAMAQGAMSVGGFSFKSGGGDAEIRNHPTVARVPDGAIVEREVPVNLSDRTSLTLQLRDADFTTAARMAKVVNMNLGGNFARAPDSGTVIVDVPPPYQGRIVELMSVVERLEVTPDQIAKVIINERTGTVIMGQDVRISPVAVSHGNLTVSIKRQKKAVPAAPLTPGSTVIEDNGTLDVTEEKANLIELDEGASLSDVVEGLNRLGASPRDLMTILQAIKEAGALRADLEVM
jgi:flagellar P-ring protein precursor FlgI